MIAEELQAITSQLPEGVRLVAVSKFHPAEAVREAYHAGQRIFGESHVQEVQRKHEELTDCPGIEWHFIGHLQTNKVKYLAPYVTLIHSVDSQHLLAEINKQAERAGRTIDCLVQLHVAAEETKFGFTPAEAIAFLASGEWQAYHNIRLAGAMAMATNTDDIQRIRSDFRQARCFLDEAQQFFTDRPGWFSELSMGMSNDWKIAIDEGATLIRLGTTIFGERQY